MKKRVRVRFAPSPTGPLHMGGVRTALYNYLFARRHGGDFLLRIEDTDQTRYVPGAEEYIKESLSWCGIKPDEGAGFGDGHHAPYRQSERKALYSRYAVELVDRGQAYYAFDTPEELESLRQRLKDEKSAVQQYGPATRGEMKNSLTLPPEAVQRLLEKGTPYVIRAKMPEDEEVVVSDLIRGEVRLNSSLLDDKVLFKSDGMPTYHLANVVDDHLMEISHVIRGEEWLPSTPLHVLLYRAFGWEQPEFAHLPLLLKPDGKGKLSKRDGDRLGFPVFPLEWTDPQSGELSSGYREKGFLPEAFVNMLALLGWSPGDDREIMSLQEMAEAFGLEKVQKAGAKYNYEKTLWFNQQYLQKESDAELAARLQDQLKDQGIEAGTDEATAVVRLIRERCILLGDLWEQGWFFFRRPESYDTGAVKKKWDESKGAFFEKVLRLFGSADTPWPARGNAGEQQTGGANLPGRGEAQETGAGPGNPGAVRLEARFKELMGSEGMKPGEVLLPLRVMLTGGRSGPGVFEIAAQLGREETLERIRQALPLFG